MDNYNNNGYDQDRQQYQQPYQQGQPYQQRPSQGQPYGQPQGQQYQQQYQQPYQQGQPYQQRPSQGQPYGQPYGQPQSMPKPVPPANGAATASLVLGIIAIAMCWTSFAAIVSVVCGIIGTVLAVKARNEGNKSGKCTGGLVLSILGLIFGGIIFISCVACVGCAATA